MTSFTGEVHCDTQGGVELQDVTGSVAEIVAQSGIDTGIVCISVVGSTGALTTIEYEPGLVQDFTALLERLAPRDAPYAHDERWHDGNGHSHVRASLIGPSVSLPVKNKKLVVGTWQQIIFAELDVRPRSRTLLVTVVGD